MDKDWRNRIVALAGMFQAANLVKNLAWYGNAKDQDAFTASIYSILQLDAPQAIDIYQGKLANLQLGLSCLVNQLGHTHHQYGQVEAE